MECNKAAKNIAGCPTKREVGKIMDSQVPAGHDLAGGGRGHVPRHAFRTKASGSRPFLCRSESIGLGKMGDFWFSSETQKKVPNVYGIFIYIYKLTSRC